MTTGQALEVITEHRTDLAHRDRPDPVASWLMGYRSKNTRAAYAADLRRFAAWCTDHDLDPMTVRRAHVDAYARTCELEGAKPSTVARRLASLASFYSWAIAEGILDSSPLTAVRRPRTGEGHVELTPALTADELAAVVAAATGPRDRVLVVLLATLGLRISEALDLDLDDRQTVRGHVTVLIHGKGGRVDRMPLPGLVVDALDQLAAAEHRTTGPVFAVDGIRWNRSQATRALARLGHAAGLARTLRPHQLRATAVTRALDLGATLRDVQDLARHSDPRTTRRYDRARGQLDRSPVFALAADIAGSVA